MPRAGASANSIRISDKLMETALQLQFVADGACFDAPWRTARNEGALRRRLDLGQHAAQFPRDRFRAAEPHEVPRPGKN